MFIPETPIRKIEDDILGRADFSRHLAAALCDWHEAESLVIAIYGSWGSGKTSVINMAIRSIEESESLKKPSIVHFSPWTYAEGGDLLANFIDTLVKAIGREKRPNKKLIRSLEYYLGLLSMTPTKSDIGKSIGYLLIAGSLLGFNAIQYFDIRSEIIRLICVIATIIMMVTGVAKALGKYILNMLKKTNEYYTKTAEEVKSEIQSYLLKRDKKLVIIVDDIDRMAEKEIKRIFQIIRTNADFPNTIYVLAFDRTIIENGLAIQDGISGRDYLEKIVQVNFNLPQMSIKKVLTYLLSELDSIFATLPEEVQAFFQKEDTYWINVFNSGYRDLFRNIRDVKRYISTLEFNLSFLSSHGALEINPIDFLAIEVIRIFEPEYYSFIENNSVLFTSVDSSFSNGQNIREEKKKKITESFEKVSDKNREKIKKLVFELFPQVKGFADGYGNMFYSGGSVEEWNQKLRICSEKTFPIYFNFVPGGDEDNINQYEISQFAMCSVTYEKCLECLDKYILNGKIEKLLIRLQDFTADKQFIKDENVSNVILALFDISDRLPEIDSDIFNFGIDMQVVRIVYQLLKRRGNKKEVYEILKNALEKTTSVYAPIHYFSLEIPRNDEDTSTKERLIPEEMIDEAKQICVKKIKSKLETLILDKNYLYIIFRWKEWTSENDYQAYIKDVMTSNDSFLSLIDKLVFTSKSQSIGDYAVKKTERFNFKLLKEFGNENEIYKRLEIVKLENGKSYVDHRKAIDLFFKQFEKRDQDFIIEE